MQDASSSLNPVYYGGLMLLAQMMGLKTVAWAQGIGPLNKLVEPLVNASGVGGLCKGGECARSRFSRVFTTVEPASICSHPTRFGGWIESR